MLDLVDLPEHGEKTPDQLSGGQKQRVALARSLAPEPDVLLLDEPFSNLDVRLRVEMREEVRQILKAAGVTAVSVTHDQEEALSISDRVAVMNEGQIRQVGRPNRCSSAPSRSSSPPSSGGRRSSKGTSATGKSRPESAGSTPSRWRATTPSTTGRQSTCSCAPTTYGRARERAELADGTIVSRQYVGPSFIYRVELESGDVVHCLHNHVEEFDLDESVGLELTARSPAGLVPAVGESLSAVLDDY